MKKFHCCATCKHFDIVKRTEGLSYKCSRLGFDTKPTYQFDCWNPKDHVIKLMQKEKKA